MLSVFLVLFQLVGDGVLQKLDGDLTGHDLALLDILADEIPILGALSMLFCSQEIPGCRDVLVFCGMTANR